MNGSAMFIDHAPARRRGSTTVALLFAGALFASCTGFGILTPLRDVESGLLKAAEGRFRCEVAVVPVSAPDPRLGWGFDFERPRTRVGGLKIMQKGTRVYSSPSVWSDLANPREVNIVLEKGGCSVLIQGGDASDGYTATLKVCGEYVVQRVVRSGEFPKEHYEKTVYGFDAPKE